MSETSGAGLDTFILSFKFLSIPCRSRVILKMKKKIINSNFSLLQYQDWLW